MVLRPTRTHGFKILFAVLLQALALAATYTSSPQVFSAADLKGILFLGVITNTVALPGTFYLLRPGFTANIVLSFIVLAGIMTAHIIFLEFFLLENIAVFIVALIVAYFTMLISFQVIDEQRWGGAVLSALTLSGLGSISGWYFLQNMGTPPPVHWTNIKDVRLQKTPNLYFISFDSIIPKSLLKKYLGLEQTEFLDVFEANFRRFPNFFTNATSTKESLNMLLSLDESIYLKYAETAPPVNFRLFSGQHPSPLLYILQQNGYETSSIYGSPYLGRRKGPYIDNYITIGKATICTLLDHRIRIYSFWGYCEWREQLQLLSGYTKPAYQAIIDHITGMHTNDKPQFVLASIYLPGHVPHRFQYDDLAHQTEFKTNYNKASNHAALYLEQMIKHLAYHDPAAILFVFGDHGTYMSQGMQIEDDPTFFIQDRYGILGGVYPRTTCTGYFDETLKQGYMTILDAVHTLLRCLSGGEDVLNAPRKYKHVSPQHPEYAYKDFLYE